MNTQKDINIIASSIKANEVKITADILNLISQKDSSYYSKFTDKSGMVVRKIKTKGNIKETIVDSKIQTNKLVFNDKDITAKLSTSNILKILSSQDDLTLEQINLVKAYTNNKQWDKTTKTLSGVGALVVQAVVTYFTAGAGSAIVAGATQAAKQAAMSMVQKMLAAAIQSMVVQASTQVASAAITGSSLKLDIKSMTTNAVKAGVLSLANNYVDQKLNIPKDNLSNQELALQTVSHTATQTAVYGGDFKDNLVNNSLNAVGAKAFEKIGHELYSENSEYKDILPPKTVTHSIIGGTISKLQGGDFSSGAIATATAHLTAQAMIDNYMDDVTSGKMSEEELVKRTKLVSTITSATITNALNPNANDNDLQIATNIGQSNVENNALNPRFFSFAVKIAKRLKNMKGKITTDKLKKELEKLKSDEIADITGDLSTILDSESSLTQKALAIADIALSTDFNNKAVKITEKVDKKDSTDNQILLTHNKNRSEPEDSTKPIKSYPATGDEKVYMGINANLPKPKSQLDLRTEQAKNPGQFLTKDKITSEAQAREVLSIPKKWKEEITHVQEYRIKKGTQIQESTVGKQVDNGRIYNGGGNQIEILNQNGNRIQNEVLIPIGKAKPIPKK